MKPEVRNRNSDIQILELQEAFLSIESLEEYYSNSILNVQKMKIQIEKEYQIGLLVDAEIKRAIDAKTKEEAISIINELNNGIAPDDNPISDYIVVECIEADEDLEFSYSIKKNAKVKSKYIDPQNAKRQYNKIKQYESILISSTLSNVIIIFEQYLAKVYQGLILINPKKYFQNQKIEIANIFNRSVRDIVIECVNNEVESNMFDSLKTLSLISERESININRFVNILDEFEEIYYRRNLYTHNNGLTNHIYLSSIKDKYKKGLDINQKLVTDDIYLRNAINMLYKVVGTLFYEIQVTCNPKYEKWKDRFSESVFELLYKKNYDVAEHLYFILSSCKQFCFRDKAMFRINYINAMKQQGKDALVKKEIEALDVSIATEDYKIAKLCLEGRDAEVYEALNKNYPEPYSAETVRDWPLFINFRESEYYTKFAQEHADEFDTFIYQFKEEEDLEVE
ncbi:hypothetical protein [Blautia sp.]